MRTSQFQSGFTYLGALFLVTLIGGALASVGIVWKTAQQREKEKELLFIGDQFKKAIMLYYEKTPGPEKKYPKSLEELVKDERFAIPERHLRKLYFDPMTRKKEWGLVTAPEGGIMGVHSLSIEAPIKTSNFGPSLQVFNGKKKYSEWEFSYIPVQRNLKQ